MDITTYAILNRRIKTAATGIADIHRDGEYIVFVMGDGTEYRVEDATKDIIDVAINNDNYIVITYIDGTTTTSDNPIPMPPVMTGATSLLDGESGLVPKPLGGEVGYLNSRGEWDSNLTEKVSDLENVVPTDNIPEGSTLTSDGWSVTDDEEVAAEFAQWEG